MALFTKKKSTSRVDPPVSARAGNVTFDGEAGKSATPPVPEIEETIRSIGTDILNAARNKKSGLLSKAFWSDKLMDWAMKDEAFKVQLFRFVDTFPMLKTSEQIHEHLTDYLSQPGVTPPPGFGLGMKAGGVAKGLFAKTVASQITSMAQKFIAGTDAASALPQLKKLWKNGMGFSVDLLGEACLSDEEATLYQQKYLDLINNLPKEVAAWSDNPILESDHLGPIPRTNVSIKISSLNAQVDPIHIDQSIEQLIGTLQPILEAAAANNVFINFDMEHHQLKDLTLELFMRCCEQFDFPAGLAMQAYLRSGDDDATRIIDWTKRTGKHITVRLVKGAYWDFETIHAEQHGWPVPVWSRKSDTDACFERMTQQFIESTPHTTGQGGVTLALGSHNVRSIAFGLALLKKHKLPDNAIELQMLHGMADQLKDVAVDRKLRLREYVPVGEMIPGMAYLVRRLLENTSNESWLLASFLEEASPDVLLASPHKEFMADPGIQRIEQSPERHQLSPAVKGVGNNRPFFTESQRDFAVSKQRKAFVSAVANASVPKVANDATAEQARESVKRAHEAFPAWRDTDPRIRANVLTKAAAIMRERRDELSGIIIKESGKTWRESDADVCEAIDFCEYYARVAVGLFERERLGNFIGELDEQWYQPRGVAVVISPWNFPLAICTGMTTAALVTGNTTIVKPAEQTPGIAMEMCDILWQAGAPKDALQFLPGVGEVVGAELVRDPRVAIIAFTGSKAVGLDIVKAAGVTPDDQPFVKKVICEMGGKNAIIVDASADLDEAVLGVRDSAFSYQGQKCSACSRAIVVETAHDQFLHRLIESTRAIVVGDPTDPFTDFGPVIDEEAAEKIRSYIQIGKSEGKLEVGEGIELGTKAPRHQGIKESALPSPKAKRMGEGQSGGNNQTPSPLRGRAGVGVSASVSDSSTHPLTPSLKGRGDQTPSSSLGEGHGGGSVLGKPIIPPHIFSQIQPHHRLANEEIFGPVLSVIKVKDFDEALKVANQTSYKLTGGIFSRKPSHLERAKREFRVGNLYLNRGCTGALVGRQPFGGFALSGVGSKAGGRDYLLQFVEPRASCENTMRRGFAPGL